MYKIIEGHINSPKGFKSAGLHSGVKKVKKDLAIVYSESPAIMAAVLTTNQVKAAPVLWNQKLLKEKNAISALIINSGNANACTGVQGKEDNEKMAALTASCLSVDASNVLVASTGVIGVPMPMHIIEEGIKKITTQLSSSKTSGKNSAEAIMTTDTFSKEVCVQVMIDHQLVTIGGMAKGSGMIHPNMATMLSFITTDAKIEQALLQELLGAVNEDTYNMISVDGDTSTNDMVIVLANGKAMENVMVKGTASYDAFKEAFCYVNNALAKLIVKDGEGASKLIEVNVTGANSIADAKQVVKSVLTSSLVKTAFFGEDANWGRILCAAGYSGIAFDPLKVGLQFSSCNGDIELLSLGEPVEFCEKKASEILSADEIKVHLSLGGGEAQAVGWGCDLSYEYVKINGAYRT